MASFVAKGPRADGHEVVVAEDGGPGLFLAFSAEVDLVVPDLGRPWLAARDVLGVVLTGEDLRHHAGLPG